MNKHPRVYQQLKERLTTKKIYRYLSYHFGGCFFVHPFLLIGVTQDYLVNNSLVLADIRITNLLYIFRNDTLLHIFYFITLFAESLVIIFLSVILSLFLWTHKQRIYIFSLWLALAIGEGLTFLGKYIFHRERPDIF